VPAADVPTLDARNPCSTCSRRANLLTPRQP